MDGPVPLFYGDPLKERLALHKPSIFLAGPTARGARPTPWRAQALRLLARKGFRGAAVIPEFRDESFESAAPRVFGGLRSPIRRMRPASYGVLRWETAGIELSTVVLFWMPFRLGRNGDPASLPGFTTRAEAGRELARAPDRLALGMPPGALSGAHIRYHAHRAGVPVHDTLSATVAAALKLARARR